MKLWLMALHTSKKLNKVKQYRDMFGNQLTKQDIASCVRFVLQTGAASALALTQQFKWGYGKSYRIMQLLEDARVVTVADLESSTPRTVILKNEDAAINAAFRQLNKGRIAK